MCKFITLLSKKSIIDEENILIMNIQNGSRQVTLQEKRSIAKGKLVLKMYAKQNPLNPPNPPDDNMNFDAAIPSIENTLKNKLLTPFSQKKDNALKTNIQSTTLISNQHTSLLLLILQDTAKLKRVQEEEICDDKVIQIVEEQNRIYYSWFSQLS